MISSTVPASIRKLSNSYKDVFEGELAQYKNHCALFCLFLFGLDSLCDAARCFVFCSSVSELSRATKCFDSNRFMRRMRSSILRKHKDLSKASFIYAIDDTANPKSGAKLFRTGLFGSSAGCFSGQKVFVVSLVNLKTGVAIPLSYAFNTKKNDPDYVNALELAGQVIEELLITGFPKLTVVADSWFGNSNFMTILENLGLEFVLEGKRNLKGKSNPGPNVCWKRITLLFAGIIRESSNKPSGKKVWLAKNHVFIKKRTASILSVAAYNRKNGLDPFAIYFSNNLQLTEEQVWKLSRARWKIECMFRDLKQEFSFGRLSGQGKQVADLAVCFPFALYTAARIDEKENSVRGKRTIGEIAKSQRSKALSQAIPYLIANSTTGAVKSFFHRRTGKSLVQKPVNRAVEAYV